MYCCKHCGKLLAEHGCVNRGCPIFNAQGILQEFSKTQKFEPVKERKDAC